jgi:hypothetical protein
VERVIHENIYDRSADRHEPPPENPAGEYKIEPNVSGTKTEADILKSELLSKLDEGDGRLEPTMEYAEATAENPTESGIEVAMTSAPELYESYELPVKDIELLLAELEASPLETQIEADQKVESVENAERSL